MKRVLLMLALLLATCSLTFAQADKMGDKHSMMDKDAMAMTEALVAKEKAVIDAIVKKDRKTFESIVASDGTISGAMGPMKVADGLDILFSKDYTLANASIENPKVMMIDKDAAILTYKSTATETYQGKSNTMTAYAVTVYAKRGAEWMAIFHQESIVTAPSASADSK